MTVHSLKKPTADASFWTGKPPIYGQCPGVREDGTIASLPQVSASASRQEILDYFDNSWTLTEVLFSALASDEAYYVRPYHQLRHPMIFYYAHPVSLYVNKLRVAGLLDGPVNAAFEQLFETGVDEMRWDDLHEGNQEIWPAVAEVREYRRAVYARIRQLIETSPLLEPQHLPITQDSQMWALLMGFEHERIHLETSSVLMREMPAQHLRKPKEWPATQTSLAPAAANTMVAHPTTSVTLGKPASFPSFGWDNEYGSETRPVRPFSASSQLISNGEFLEFVRAGGYAQEKYWSREGWAWRRFRNIKWPTFWVQDGPAGSHLYKLRTIFEVIEMPESWPVCVNFHEAKAYCTWRTEQEGSATPYRLLTEAEHNALRDGSAPYNANLTQGSECPVDSAPLNSKGHRDVFGNVWQWCEDHFHPLEGGTPHPYYDDFSLPCYDGEHQMILGGSFISTGDEASAFARFHFRPHFFQHAGFRIARNEDGNPACDARQVTAACTSYETEVMLNNYTLMHWGSREDIYDSKLAAENVFPNVPNLPVRCAELVVQFAHKKETAFDLGCALARSSFEMARHFQQVVGLDYSRSFVEAAERLRQKGELPYMRKETGDEYTPLVARVDKDIDRSRLRFEQGSACALPLHLKGFDAVLMANVLCRLPEPAACLERMQGVNALVAKGGVLVMTTPFSWLEQYTPPDRWIKDVQAVAAHLSEFELIHEEEIPFMIREHRRKFEYVVTRASVWRRKE
jgi:5-histidylcysteine sulfoxide synthase/putative 4-mercaptohistidine N1-methyltranferase